MHHGKGAATLLRWVLATRQLSTVVLFGVVIATVAFSSPAAASTPWQVEFADSALELNGWTTDDESGSRDFYSIVRDGKVLVDSRETSYELRLRFDTHDPLRGTPREIPGNLTSGAGNELYLVQFVTQPMAEFRAELERRGVRIVRYFPRHSYIVRAAADVAAGLDSLDFVRWVGAYAPAYRIEEFVRENLDTPAALGTLTYSVLLTDAAIDVKLDVANRIESIGGVVDKVQDGKFHQRVTLSPQQLLKVLQFNEVLWVDRWSPLENDMDVVRAWGGADFLEAGPEGYTGQGVRGEVFDSGFNEDHVDFENSPLIRHNSVDTSSHGASTSGIVFGDGIGDPDARGLLPDGQGIIGDYGPVGLDDPDRYDYTGELVQAPYFAVFQTCSAGSNRTEEYTNASALMDDILFDFDLVACQSQSNAGTKNSRPQAWAKNIIAVGGVNHENTASRADDNWSSGASIGPAEDNRVKPDLTHFYDSVRTTTCCGNESYTQFSGTSAATPIVCGHVGLFFQMWADGAFGNAFDPNATVFENRSHMTTAKAAMINSAIQYNWKNGGPNSDLDRAKQGWGLPNLRNLDRLKDQLYIIDETDVLENLESTDHQVVVANGERALKATMVYADPSTVPGANLHRINNVSMLAISPSGDEYWGNWGLFTNLWSAPGGREDERNTVENVYVLNPEAGTWTIRVIASEVVEDGHVETGALDVDYALWVSGITP